MVGGKKKAKICDKGLQEDLISELPDALICEILSHLSTKEAIRTSVLSKKWRNLWQCVPGMDLDSSSFKDANGFVKFIDSQKESSWIRKLRLHYDEPYGQSYVPPWIHVESSFTPWIDAVSVRRIHHLDVGDPCARIPDKMPLSIYTCETLVQLRISWAALVHPKFVSLPCLKILHLDNIYHPKEATLEKLISRSPVLEELTMVRFSNIRMEEFIRVRSQTLKRICIDKSIQVVVDAPLLQFLSTKIGSRKNFKIVNLGFSTKLDFDVGFCHTDMSQSMIQDFLADISRVRDLVISHVFWKQIFLYSESGPLFEFRHLSRLSAKFSKSDLEMLPTILESCPKLESLTLELVSCSRKSNIEPKVTFSTVPPCLVSSLKYVELKRLISRYEGETELVRYLLKNSRILEKLRLETCYTKKAMLVFVKEVVAMPRCSSACQVIVL